jgi:hypothetical protein
VDFLNIPAGSPQEAFSAFPFSGQGNCAVGGSVNSYTAKTAFKPIASFNALLTLAVVVNDDNGNAEFVSNFFKGCKGIYCFGVVLYVCYFCELLQGVDDDHLEFRVFL